MTSRKKKNTRGNANSGKRKGARHPWAKWPIERLLDLRMCDLKLSLKGTQLEEHIERIREELEHRDLDFRPYFWIADDWFTPWE